MENLIQNGQGVILKKGKNLKYVYVTENKQEKMENFFFACMDMIGKPYGTAFRVVNKSRLEVIDPIQVEEYRSEYEKLADDSQEEETKDNRDITDNPDSQKLDKETIMALREDGVAGEKIVEKLVENSATFKDRTEFSQAKYLKKKQKKYIPQFVVLKPNTRLLCQMYFFKSPDKILDIRPDTLAQILTWSNVQAGSKVLLMETCRGLIAGAMMDRLGTDGTLVQIHQGNNPMRTVVEQFNFTVNDAERLLCSFPLEKIENFKNLEGQDCDRKEMLEAILGKKYVETETTTEELEQKLSGSTPVQEIKQVEPEGKLIASTKPDENPDTNVSSPPVDVDNVASQTENKIKPVETTTLDTKDTQATFRRNDRKRKQDNENDWRPALPRVTYLSKEKRVIECEKAMKLLSEKQFDSLVIAAKYHPKNILLSLLEFLPPSRPFVVYCQQKEPLMDCFVVLKDMKIVVNLELTESWYRNLQVLSNRTHPEIVMSATGGYLLRGIKVSP